MADSLCSIMTFAKVGCWKNYILKTDLEIIAYITNSSKDHFSVDLAWDDMVMTGGYHVWGKLTFSFFISLSLLVDYVTLFWPTAYTLMWLLSEIIF